MNKTELFASQVRTILQNRIDDPAAVDNFKKNMAVELRELTKTASIAYMVEHDLPASPLNDIAIYALQKVRKLIDFATGAASKIDPFSEAIIKNALAMKDREISYDGKLQMAGLSKEIEHDHRLKLPVRRDGSKGTASTQASSTRAALQYLGMASVGKGGVMTCDWENPVLRRLVNLPPVEEADAELNDGIVVAYEPHHASVVKYRKKDDTRLDAWMMSGAMSAEAVAGL